MTTKTQREIADKLGVTQPCVARWLSGRHTPNVTTIERLADAYEVSITDMWQLISDKRATYLDSTARKRA